MMLGSLCLSSERGISQPWIELNMRVGFRSPLKDLGKGLRLSLKDLGKGFGLSLKDLRKGFCLSLKDLEKGSGLSLKDLRTSLGLSLKDLRKGQSLQQYDSPTLNPLKSTKNNKVGCETDEFGRFGIQNDGKTMF